MVTGIVSSLTSIPVKKDVAMTGEITLRGRVLPIGGLKEKLLAAHREGIGTVVVPKENESDLQEIQPFILDSINVLKVETVDEVLAIALSENMPQRFS
jgi:ATP-dependent Lon protease